MKMDNSNRTRLVSDTYILARNKLLAAGNYTIFKALLQKNN